VGESNERIGTRVVRTARVLPSGAGTPLVPPLVQSVAFDYGSMDEQDAIFANERPGWVYGRYGTPTTAALERALAMCDLLVTTGGASGGERDLVKSTLVGLGARFAFRSVAMRPAKPAAFALVGITPVAVLPGNPAAAFVGYAALVRGIARRLAGHRVAFTPAVPARLEGTIHAKADRHFILFGSARHKSAALSVLPVDNQCSSLVRTSADANCLIVVPPGSGDLEPGATVLVELLDRTALGMFDQQDDYQLDGVR